MVKIPQFLIHLELCFLEYILSCIFRTRWRESSEGPWRWLRDWSILYTRKGRESWGCLAWRREGSRGISSMYVNIWREGAKRTEPRFSLPSDRTRGKGHNLKHRRCHLNVRKHFVRVTEHWHQLPREVVESPSLEIFRSHLDPFLGNKLYMALPEQYGWTRWPSHVLSNLNHSVILWVITPFLCLNFICYFLIHYALLWWDDGVWCRFFSKLCARSNSFHFRKGAP